MLSFLSLAGERRAFCLAIWRIISILNVGVFCVPSRNLYARPTDPPDGTTTMEKLGELGEQSSSRVMIGTTNGSKQAQAHIPGGGARVLNGDDFPGSFTPGEEGRMIRVEVTGPKQELASTCGQAVGIILRGFGQGLENGRMVMRRVQALLICGGGSGGVTGPEGKRAMQKVQRGFWGSVTTDVHAVHKKSSNFGFGVSRKFIPSADVGRSDVWLSGGCEAMAVAGASFIMEGVVGEGSGLREAQPEIRVRAP